MTTPQLVLSTEVKYGRLQLTGNKEPRRYGQCNGYIATFFECRCDCGKIKWIRGSNIKRIGTRSCGCYRAELAKLVHKYRMKQ